jgi:hypothetical protein
VINVIISGITVLSLAAENFIMEIKKKEDDLKEYLKVEIDKFKEEVSNQTQTKLAEVNDSVRNNIDSMRAEVRNGMNDIQEDLITEALRNTYNSATEQQTRIDPGLS